MNKLSRVGIGAIVAIAALLASPAVVGTESVVVAEGGPWCC